MAEILDKTREWSERFGSVLRASAETQYPQLYKGAVGGLEHVISVDNGGSYMEMWRDGGDQYYATTGAAIKPLPGLAKGARLDEALDRFFVLMTKVEKDAGARPERGRGQRQMRRAAIQQHRTPKQHYHGRGGQPSKREWEEVERRKRSVYDPNKPYTPPMQSRFGPGGAGQPPPIKRAIPKKFKRLAGVRKNVVEKVDPEIGPSMSVGHRKPSDLSPESSVRKLAKRIITDINKAMRGHEVDIGGQPAGAPGHSHKHRKGSRLTHAAARKNVVALTGNQPGSGRVKPARTRMVQQHKDKQGSTAHHKRGKAPGVPQGDPSRGKPQRLGGNWFVHTREVGGKPYYMIENTKTGEVDHPVFYRTGGVGYDRPEVIPPSVRARVQQLGPPSRGRKVSNIEGGRVQPGGGTKPVQPRQSGPGVPTGYAPKTGATEFSQREPTYDYGRYRKACPCNEVAKTMKAVIKQGQYETVAGRGGKPKRVPSGYAGPNPNAAQQAGAKIPGRTR